VKNESSKKSWAGWNKLRRVRAAAKALDYTAGRKIAQVNKYVMSAGCEGEDFKSNQGAVGKV
jgi:hypothetical protein